MKWIKCSERLPEDLVNVLVRFKCDCPEQIMFYDKREKMFLANACYLEDKIFDQEKSQKDIFKHLNKNITHWAETPELPRE